MRETFHNRPIYSLSEITQSIKSMVAKTYNHAYYIKAEILKLNYYPHSGHCFPELVEKENGKIKSQLRAIIWSQDFQVINERFRSITNEPLKENINILCLATIEFNVQHGVALFIQDIEPIYTLGEIEKNKRETIAKLKAENIFTLNKQQYFPLIPKRIAIISVETSKGYSDFMITLQQNSWNYKFNCTLFPSILQGDKAIISIAHQIEEITKRRQDFDCIVIVRGGGGDVGMSCYDDYSLTKKIATAPLPIISGIGHSTNETITDMVAYANKITPTEVAYFLIQRFHDFSIQLDEIQSIIVKKTLDTLKDQAYYFEQIESVLLHCIDKWSTKREQELEKCSDNLKIYLTQLFEKEKTRLEQAGKMVSLLHPENVLKRGYSITLFNGKSITDASSISEDAILTTKFYKGEIKSKVEK